MDGWKGIDSFVAVTDFGSFTTAADSLGVSVSLVSREIALLEKKLGTKLLIRTTRNVTLTEAGRMFAEKCRRLIEDRDSAFDSVRENGDEISGQIRITCSIAYGETTIVPLINQFAVDFPHVIIELDLSNSIRDLIADGYDLAIRVGELSDQRLSKAPLGKRTLHTCAAPAYLELFGVPQSIEELRSHETLLGATERWSFRDQSGRNVQFTPAARLRCNNGFGVLDATKRGIGICQLPDFYVHDGLLKSELIEVLLEYAPVPQDIWVTFPKRPALRKPVEALMSYLNSRLPVVVGA